MKHASTAFALTLVSLGLLCTGNPACAAEKAAEKAAERPTDKPLAPTDGKEAAAATDRSEPNVKYTVIEDEGSRIDELRVRGQTQRITVTPKTGGKVLAGRPYEIISPSGSQDLQEAPNGVKGAAGKRVWHVLSF